MKKKKSVAKRLINLFINQQLELITLKFQMRLCVRQRHLQGGVEIPTDGVDEGPYALVVKNVIKLTKSVH